LENDDVSEEMLELMDVFDLGGGGGIASGLSGTFVSLCKSKSNDTDLLLALFFLICVDEPVDEKGDDMDRALSDIDLSCL
jgi:hypothetical protein